MSLFITFEGCEGSGKSYQSKTLHNKLQKLAVPSILIHEPGSTPLGEKITRLLKWAQETDISPLTELLLFNASRSQLITEVIQPALDSNEIVICDRYTDSTVVYQGYGRGLDMKIVKNINYTGAHGLKPDLTILLDIMPDHGLARKSSEKNDRFENEDIAFHWRVKQGYLELAAAEPHRWLVIDGTQSKKMVASIIWKKISSLLSQKEN